VNPAETGARRRPSVHRSALPFRPAFHACCLSGLLVLCGCHGRTTLKILRRHPLAQLYHVTGPAKNQWDPGSLEAIADSLQGLVHRPLSGEATIPFGSAEGAVIGAIASAQAVADGSVLIADRMYNRLDLFRGRVLVAATPQQETVGQGIIGPIAIASASARAVWLLDSLDRLYRIRVSASGVRIVRTIQTSVEAEDMCTTSTGVVIINGYRAGTSKVLHEFNENARRIGTIGRPYETGNYVLLRYLALGRMACLGTHVLLAPYYLGIVVSWNTKAARLEWSVRIPGFVPPSLREFSNGGVQLAFGRKQYLNRVVFFHRLGDSVAILQVARVSQDHAGGSTESFLIDRWGHVRKLGCDIPRLVGAGTGRLFSVREALVDTLRIFRDTG
jgi:hypothetical protein